ncbi:MAG: virginiamycin lyase [Actinomycetota bacterium]|nr:virginiamycin lyase [Actinomycetota bacterium]
MKSKEAEYISGGMIDLAITPHGVWTLDWINERLVEIDPKSLKITAEIPVGVEGGALTYGDGSLWLATGKGSGKGLLFQVDPETSEVVNKYEFPDSGLLGHAQAGDGLLWIGEDSSDKLMRVDPLTGKFLHELHMSEPVSEIRYEAGALWAIGTKGTLYRLDPQTGKVQSQITVGDTGAGLAVSGQQIAVRLDDTSIAMVDPRTESVTNTYDGLPTAEIAGGGLDFAYGSLWATNWTDATIWRFN